MLGPLVISLKDELVFIKSILIPAFNPDNELDTSKQRNEWMRMRAINIHWDAGIYEQLLIRYGTVTSLDEAKLEKAETERKFAEVEVEVERKLEMVEAEMQRKLELAEMQRKLGKKSIISLSFIAFTLILSFVCIVITC